MELLEPLRASNIAAAVFDLDSTLWHGNLSVHDGARLVRSDENELASLADSTLTLRLYDGVRPVLNALHQANVPIAIASASRSGADRAREILRLLELSELVKHYEVHHGSKQEHLKSISLALGVPLKQTIFFDDLDYNLTAVRALGCTCIKVRDGLGPQHVLKGLQELKGTGKQASMMDSFVTRSPRVPKRPLSSH